MTHWSVTLEVSDVAVQVLLRGADGRIHLKARLPHPPRHPRALMTLLEALALWNGQVLCAAICVAGSAVPSPGSQDGQLPLPEDTPLVQFHFLLRRRRDGGLRDASDLRRLGLLR